MSNYSNVGDAAQPGPDAGGQRPRGRPPSPQPPERVALGLLASLLAVVGGVVLTVVIWRAGYIASITSFVIAIGAVYLYTAAAGVAAAQGPGAGRPRHRARRRCVVLRDRRQRPARRLRRSTRIDVAGAGASTKQQFVMDNVFNTELLAEYGKDLAMFVAVRGARRSSARCAVSGQVARSTP